MDGTVRRLGLDRCAVSVPPMAQVRCALGIADGPHGAALGRALDSASDQSRDRYLVVQALLKKGNRGIGIGQFFNLQGDHLLNGLSVDRVLSDRVLTTLDVSQVLLLFRVRGDDQISVCFRMAHPIGDEESGSQQDGPCQSDQPVHGSRLEFGEGP